MNIYKITNIINNKIYIGMTTKSINERFIRHKYMAENNTGYYLHNAMNKYGFENFIIQKIDEAVNLEELKEKEIFYIEKFNSFKTGYNLTRGGDFTANDEMVVVTNKENKIFRVTKEEFKNDVTVFSINKNKVTIFKDGCKLRVLTDEYENKYFKLGWRSKNYGFTTVISKSGERLKIEKNKFDKNIYDGINIGKQLYFDNQLQKFVLIKIDEVDLNKHYNKQKCKYYLYDDKDNIIYTTLSKSLPEDFGGLQFRYLINKYKDNNEWLLSEEVLNKLKPKNRNYNFLNYKFVKDQL